MARTCHLAVLLTLALAPTQAHADLITYEWNDEFTDSTFAGSFTVDTDRLTDARGGGKLLTSAGIVSSAFQFRAGRFPGAPLVFFSIQEVWPTPGITIDPLTGAVRADGILLFGVSNVVQVGNSPYQVLGGQVSLNRDYNVIGPPGAGQGGQRAFLSDTRSPNPNEFLASVGHWDVRVSSVPAPSTLCLALTAGVCGLLGRLGRRRSG